MEREECDSQSERTLEECMRYILRNETSTDVSIEVGPPDGETVTFRAHKCILMSRSEVFEGMFSSGMAECRNGPEANQAKVRVVDIDADVFRQLLDYLYFGTTPICLESAVYLLYAAKKYMLPKLISDCSRCLLESLNIDNVIQFLDHSLNLDEELLEKACRKLISNDANYVLTGAEILSASRLVMGAILDAKAIPVRESVLYDTAVNWAKHQFQSNIPGESLTDLQIRETLGDLLYKIRFPNMKQSEFAEMSVETDVLTAEEKNSVYYYMATGKAHQLKFPTERRIGETVWIDRTEKCLSRRWQSTPGLDAINFTSDKNVLLNGIGLFTGYRGRGYVVDVEILESDNSLFKKTVTIPFSGDATPIEVLLDEPVMIQAGVVYLIKALAHDVIGHYGCSCNEVCTKETVTFTFSSHSESKFSTSTRGQIPRLYFCVL